MAGAGSHPNFPNAATHEMTKTDYERFYKGGQYQRTTLLAYSCTYSEKDVTCNLKTYRGKVKTLTMWINNSLYNDDEHECAKKLAYSWMITKIYL